MAGFMIENGTNLLMMGIPQRLKDAAKDLQRHNESVQEQVSNSAKIVTVPWMCKKLELVNHGRSLRG